MTSPEPHKKHADARRATAGQFHRRELALLGTTCEEVKLQVQRIRTWFPEHLIAYADESHAHADEPTQGHQPNWHKEQGAIDITSVLPDNRFQRIFSLSQADAVIVNGNHFEAARQLIICNPEKEKSLLKRKEQLTDVVAIVLTGSQSEVPTYAKPWAEGKPVVHLDDEAALKNLIYRTLLEPAPLRGLIMAGGKSVRMGQDKPWIPFNGSPQALHLSALLKQAGIEAIVSCRAEQREHFEKAGLKTITDRISDFGPLGGIASAFMDDPDSAWMVLASDIPLLDADMLRSLMEARKPGHMATAFVSPHDGMPEPLAAIWEPAMFQQIMQFISLGYSCPRKVLMNASTHLLTTDTPQKLMNVNTPEDLASFHQHASRS